MEVDGIQMMKEFNIGDKVYVHCYTSMGNSSEGEYRILDITRRWDQYTGKPFPVIHTEAGSFHGGHGDALNGVSMYYIDIDEVDEPQPNQLELFIEEIKAIDHKYYEGMK